MQGQQAESVRAARCEACGGSAVTEIVMTLTDGSQVRFVSCRSCEAKVWRESGAPLALSTVMAKARKTVRPGPPPRRG